MKGVLSCGGAIWGLCCRRQFALQRCNTAGGHQVAVAPAVEGGRGRAAAVENASLLDRQTLLDGRHLRCALSRRVCLDEQLLRAADQRLVIDESGFPVRRAAGHSMKLLSKCSNVNCWTAHANTALSLVAAASAGPEEDAVLS